MDNALVMLHHKIQPLDPKIDIFVSNLVEIPKSGLALVWFLYCHIWENSYA